MRKGDTTVKKSIIDKEVESRRGYEGLEEMVRFKVQEFSQEILEEEVEDFLGRKQSERRKKVDGVVGYRNGYGKPKRFTLIDERADKGEEATGTRGG